MIRYFWDFFGPMGRGTADHFRRHLKQFLTENKIEETETGIDNYSPTHSAAWCTVPIETRALIEGRLRPRRAELQRSSDEDGTESD